ncbi:MAG: type II secretion system protein [Patescibacteria group bacterium]|nr:type II secretion system protein [Patescibacteria group bacterium]
MVVISIIGFLATAAMLAFNIARQEARDARRKTDLLTIAKALELYYDDYGHYPVSNNCGSGGRTPLAPETDVKGAWAYHATHASDRLIATLKNRGYIGSYITDPLDPDFSKHLYYYYTDIKGQHFVLMAYLESPSDEDIATQDDAPPPVSECNLGNYRLIR